MPVLQDARQKLEEALFILKPYILTLNAEERQPLEKLGIEHLTFIEKSYQLNLKYPEMIPEFFEKEIFTEEFFKARALLDISEKLDQIKEELRDTKLAAGNLGLRAAFAFYNTVKIAARHKIPGTAIIYEELKPIRPAGKWKP